MSKRRIFRSVHTALPASLKIDATLRNADYILMTAGKRKCNHVQHCTLNNVVSRIIMWVRLSGTHSPNRLVWSEGWRPPGAQSAFIKWTGWTLAMTVSWWQHHKHCRGKSVSNYSTLPVRHKLGLCWPLDTIRHMIKSQQNSLAVNNTISELGNNKPIQF